MRWRTAALRGLAFVCALAVVYSVVQALGVGPFEGLSGDPPSWVDGPLYWIVLANGFMSLLIAWRGVTPGVAAVLTVGGITTILATGISQVFEGSHFYTPPPGEVAFLAGFVLAAIGIWRLDPRTLYTEVSGLSSVMITLGVGLGVLVGEAVFGAVSTTVWLLPLLWANGVGSVLAPLAILGGVRWLATAGIQVDDKLGVRMQEYTGLQWNWRAAIHTGENPQIVRAGCIIVATIGSIIVLLTPAIPYVADTSLSTAHTQMGCAGPTWATSLKYRADWSTIYLRWPNGCNGSSAFVNWRYGVVGSVLGLGGAVGERLTLIRDR